MIFVENKIMTVKLLLSYLDPNDLCLTLKNQSKKFLETIANVNHSVSFCVIITSLSYAGSK